MILLILGPSGSGKGTQAKKLAKKYDLHFISMGSLLRDAAKESKEINQVINKKGKLVPAYTTFRILKDYLDKKGLKDNIILDGYPRMIKQYEFLKTWLKEVGRSIDIAFVLEIGEEEVYKRLSGRRMDPKTGKIFNLNTFPKPGPDIDVSKLVQREDSKKEAIEERLGWYKNDVLPLIKALEEDEKVQLERVDGERDIEEIQKELVKIVEERMNEGR